MLPRTLPLLLLASVLGTPVGAAEVRRLNGPLARAASGTFFPGSSPDGRVLVYPIDAGGGTFELRSVALDGKHRPVHLPDPSGSWTFSRDGKRLVFPADPDGDGLLALHSTAVDGSAALLPLSGPFVPGGNVLHLQASQDGVHVVYWADQERDEVLELFAVAADASAPMHRLNGPLVAGGNVQAWTLSGDGRTAAYLADQETDERVELFVVPVDGCAPARKLPLPLVAGGAVAGFALDPTGSRLVYVADQEEDERFELFSMPTDGNAPPRKLNAPLVADGDVGELLGGSLFPSFQLSLDGRWVAYAADQEEDERFELFSVPADGSRPAVRLSRAGDRAASQWTQSWDSAWVVYSAEPSGTGAAELFSAPFDGSSPARALSGPMVPGGDAFFPQVSFDGRFVVWEADALEDGVHELFGAPIDGSAPALRLNPPLVPGGDVTVDRRNLLPGFWVMASGVMYEADQEVDGRNELYFAPFPLGSPVRKLAQGPVGLAVPLAGHLELPPRDFGGVAFEREGGLFSVGVEADSDAILLDALPRDRTVGDVGAFELAPSGMRALYRAREEGDLSSDLYSVQTGERRAAVQLHPEGTHVLSMGLSPDGTRAFVVRGPASGPFALHALPADGSGPDVLLHPGEVLDPLFTPDGAHVLFRAEVAGGIHLLSVASDGSSPSAWLSAALPPDRGVVGTPKTSADGRWVAFRAVGGSALELHVAPVDGHLPAVRVSAAGQRAMDDFVLASDGSLVFFRTDASGTRQGELFVAPRDASEAPRRLSAPLVAFGDVLAFAVAADDRRVAYLADQEVDERRELFSVPVEGGAPPVRLSGALEPEEDVADFVLAPDGQRLVFRADLVSDGVLDLFSVPLDASAAPVRLGRSVLDYRIGSDSRRVVFRATEAQGTVALFAAPLRGSRLPRRLGGAPHPGGHVRSFQVSADARTVAFAAERDAFGRLTLLVAPTGGGEKAIELPGPFQGGGSVYDYRLSADGSRALWRADPEVPGVVELFAADTPRAGLLRRR